GPGPEGFGCLEEGPQRLRHDLGRAEDRRRRLRSGRGRVAVGRRGRRRGRLRVFALVQRGAGGYPRGRPQASKVPAGL
ncbi:MAG: hypothetical protein AVDCRST_MAG02-1774, partial [uncultured Rubrobacteraceae bacterium]